MYYIIINEICANKPHRLRRSEAMGMGYRQTIIFILYNNLTQM